MIARNRSDPSEYGRCAGDLVYPKAFSCFGVSADKRRHERDLRPRVERRSLCHKKSDEREQQANGWHTRTRQEEVSFSSRLKQSSHFRAPEIPVRSGSDGTDFCRSCRCKKHAQLRRYRRSTSKLICLISQQIAVRIKTKVRDCGMQCQHAKRVRYPGKTVISCAGDCVKKFFAASEKVPILRVSASVA